MSETELYVSNCITKSMKLKHVSVAPCCADNRGCILELMFSDKTGKTYTCLQLLEFDESVTVSLQLRLLADRIDRVAEQGTEKSCRRSDGSVRSGEMNGTEIYRSKVDGGNSLAVDIERDVLRDVAEQEKL